MKWPEYCGVIAVYSKAEHAALLCHRGLFALQHRGQQSAGIVSSGHHGRLMHLRGRGLVSEALPTAQVAQMSGHMAIGHVRYSTVPFDRAENIQPFMATTPYGHLAVAHNGNLKNMEPLRQRLEQAGALLSTSMDTELLIHLVARSQQADLPSAFAHAAAQVEGSYSLTMLLGQKICALRDAHGIRPLVWGRIHQGFVVASETCAIISLGGSVEGEIGRGEWFEVGPNGCSRQQILSTPKPAPCVFELVYFARPDSHVFGQGVHSTRVRMGEYLAQNDIHTPLNADCVVPVPDSGFSAAIGYARKSGIELEKAIIRSHYIGRTFILPNQDSRSENVQLKLSVIAEAIANKSVVLVDDSLVRGNTARLIVQMVRKAGAHAVHLRIAAPPLRYPCYLGIDTPSKEELVINQQRHVEGVRQFIGADSLSYLSQEALALATKQQPFCTGCMTGKYPL